MMYSFDFDGFRKKVQSLGIAVRRVQREIGVTNYNTARHILDFDDGSLLSRILQFCNVYDIRFEDYMLIDGKPMSALAEPEVENNDAITAEFSTDDSQNLHPDLHLQGDLLAVILKHNESVAKQNSQQLREAYERIIADKDHQIAEWKARAERLERELNGTSVSAPINTYINERERAYHSLNR